MVFAIEQPTDLGRAEIIIRPIQEALDGQVSIGWRKSATNNIRSDQ
jgi:hypothetical protein